MIMEVLPVLPPNCVRWFLGWRPFCDFRLNDLYRRVINRNNRFEAPDGTARSGNHRAATKTDVARRLTPCWITAVVVKR